MVRRDFFPNEVLSLGKARAVRSWLLLLVLGRPATVVSVEATVSPVEARVLSAEATAPPVGATVPPVEPTVPSVEVTVPSVEATVPPVELTVPPVEAAVPSVEAAVPSVEVTVPSVEATVVPSVDAAAALAAGTGVSVVTLPEAIVPPTTVPSVVAVVVAVSLELSAVAGAESPDESVVATLVLGSLTDPCLLISSGVGLLLQFGLFLGQGGRNDGRS